MLQPMWVSVAASSALAFPSDGEGNSSGIRANSTALGATTFTEKTVTDAGGWTLSGAQVGDYVAVTTGEWGVVQSKSGTTITVDKWRCHIVGQRSPATRTPATGGAGSVVVYGPNILSGAIETRIGSISFPLTTATQTCAFTDPFGNALANLTFTVVAGQGQTYFGECNEGNGLPLYRPFGLKCSSTGLIALVQFAVIR